MYTGTSYDDVRALEGEDYAVPGLKPKHLVRTRVSPAPSGQARLAHAGSQTLRRAVSNNSNLGPEAASIDDLPGKAQKAWLS